MIERYTLPRMGEIWSERNKFQKWLDIEILVCEALAELGRIPWDAVRGIKQKASFDLQRIREIEKETRHDVVAFLTNLAENIGEEAKFIHLGLTSSDILDTSLALLLREAAEIIILDLEKLLRVLKRRALEYKRTLMVGRTHGVHAEPITLGLKIALWWEETKRNLERMRRARENISFGKISGAVGTYAHVDPFVEQYVCKKLGLYPAPISSQIVQRDRHAEYMAALAITASSLEKFATEIRGLQRTEIREVEEPFYKGQKGSSAMPHKRNPIICERICGLARIIRANVLSALENIPLWGERDISHSSVERVALPDSTILLDYMLNKFIQVMEGLIVYPENMKKNMEKSQGLIFSQRVLLKLVEKGASREEAYKMVQRNALRTWRGEGEFKKLLEKDEGIKKFLSFQDIEVCFDLNYFLETAERIFKRLNLTPAPR